MREKYESLSLAILKDLAKARGIKGGYAMKKQELVERMLEEDERHPESLPKVEQEAAARSEAAPGTAQAAKTGTLSENGASSGTGAVRYEAPSGSAPAGTAASGTTPLGSAPARTAASGTTPLGSAPAGTAASGTTPLGSAPAGTASSEAAASSGTGAVRPETAPGTGTSFGTAAARPEGFSGNAGAAATGARQDGGYRSEGQNRYDKYNRDNVQRQNRGYGSYGQRDYGQRDYGQRDYGQRGTAQRGGSYRQNQRYGQDNAGRNYSSGDGYNRGYASQDNNSRSYNSQDNNSRSYNSQDNNSRNNNSQDNNARSYSSQSYGNGENGQRSYVSSEGTYRTYGPSGQESNVRYFGFQAGSMPDNASYNTYGGSDAGARNASSGETVSPANVVRSYGYQDDASSRYKAPESARIMEQDMPYRPQDDAMYRPYARQEGDGSQGEQASQVEERPRELTPQSEQVMNEYAIPAETMQLDSGEKACGILEVMPDGYGFIRCENYLPGENDVYVSPSQIRRFNLKTGDIIQGNIRIRTQGEKFSALLYLTSLNGFHPDEGQKRYNFEDMTPIFPYERLVMERPGGTTAMRIVDLISPIGKGQRGMIVSPPKAGKTTLLKDVAKSIVTNNKEMHLIMLLIDERPEEVTDIKEAIEGENVEVIYSTFDELPEHHRRVSEMVIERARRLVEHKKDVIILLDSITRLARAYNLIIPPSGRTLSGGLDPAALHMPKRFFGAARKMREGGSLTILATALVDTGSKMDDVIYEEFKGTGNMELVLDRKLQERRVFPAIDIQKSGTRREDLLLTAEEQEAVYNMRKALNGLKPEDAVEQIISLFSRTKTNAEFVQTVKKQKF